MTKKTAGYRRNRDAGIAALLFGALSVQLCAQIAPTLQQREVFDNVDKLETKITLDKAEYLPRETARITVTVRNPMSVPLHVAQPFHQQTGFCEVSSSWQRPTGASDAGYPAPDTSRAYTHHIRWDVPTVVLAPGQEITQTASTKDTLAWEGRFLIPNQPGEWTVTYSYDHRAHTDFKVVQPARVTAMSMVHLPPEEITDYETRKLLMKSLLVPFLAVEIQPGEYWLVRSDPMNEDISYRWNPKYTPDIFRHISFFETVGHVDEEVRSLRTELRDDGTVDVIADTVSGRQSVLHAPARAAKLASSGKQ